jgi:hypothetical protein
LPLHKEGRSRPFSLGLVAHLLPFQCLPDTPRSHCESSGRFGGGRLGWNAVGVGLDFWLDIRQQHDL